MIHYRSGYKYQLAADYSVQTFVLPERAISTEYIRLSTSGLIEIKEGYAWDGPSGPTFDTKNFMRGSLVHDAFYQLMRENHLKPILWRERVDRELQRMCREDGMSAIRAWWVYQGVRFGGRLPSDPGLQNRPVLTAP